MKLTARAVAPAINLESIVGVCELTSGSHQKVKLVPDCPLDPEVVHGSLTDWQRWAVTGGGRKRIWNFVFEVPLKDDTKDDYRNLLRAVKRTTRPIDRVVSSLRIAKSGNVWAPLIMIRMERNGALAGSWVVNEGERWDACEEIVDDPADWMRTGDDLFPWPYVIETDDVNEIQNVLNAMSRHLAARLRLKAAIAKFNRLFDRRFSLDAVVDTCVALEALYRPLGKGKAAQVRQAIEGDLGGDSFHHAALDAIPDWYDIRNDLLHDGEVSLGNKDKSQRTTEEFPGLRELLRQAIRVNLLKSGD